MDFGEIFDLWILALVVWEIQQILKLHKIQIFHPQMEGNNHLSEGFLSGQPERVN